MDLILIPTITIIGLLAIGSPSETLLPIAVSKQGKDLTVAIKKIETKIETKKINIDSIEEKIYNPINEDLEYKTIYKYITKKYKNIAEEDAEQIAHHLVSYGQKENIDPKLIAALMDRESGFNKNAVSSTGAKGLGQIKSFNYPSLNISNPHNIKENTRGTIKYVKEMLNGWKNKSNKTALALASYYKGINAIKKKKGVLDKITKNYVADILGNYDKIKKIKEELNS